MVWPGRIEEVRQPKERSREVELALWEGEEVALELLAVHTEARVEASRGCFGRGKGL
jgi:hypothetical protein